MKDEIKKILNVENYRNKDGYVENINLLPDEIHKLLDYITNLQEENEKLKELCNKYEEEHSTTFQIWKYNKDTYKEENERLNNIIDELEKYLKEQIDEHYSWHYREWIRQVLDKLNKLKGDNK